MFAAWTGQLHRPTKDVDFLGFGSPAPVDVADRIRQILSETEGREGTNDGLVQDANSELPPPVLSSYPQPTVIAEKTQAITILGIANSRLKDFYDLWMICTSFPLQADECVRAIRQTFERRQTAIEIEPLGLTDTFWDDKTVRA